HAIYGEHEASFAIDDVSVLAGQIPPRAAQMATEWAVAHREELLANWDKARRAEPLALIAPLD
ncbi:MAG: DUF4160 domain-containing protein, partial [Sulfobacillus sp.]